MSKGIEFQHFSFLLLSLSFLALVVMAIIGSMPYWAWFIPVGVGIFSTLIVFQAITVPQRIVSHGMELIQAQDYNNRLVKVGEPNADKIVELFNSLIDKLRAERLLNREQESLLSLLIEASPMGVVMLDFDKNIKLANKSFLKILGLSKIDEIINKPLDHLKFDLIPEIIKIPLGKSEIIRKGFFKIYRIYHLNFVQEGFKREFFLLESLTDEIMKAEKAAYEKVIRTISHEVNNSMGGVKAVLEFVGDNTEDEELKKVVESCNLRCEMMGNFIKEYADVVKLPQPLLRPLDLIREIESMLPFLQRIVPENVELKFLPSIDSAQVMADISLLQQVILNIVKNAADSLKGYTSRDEKGFIEISLGLTEKSITLSISDNGKPIDETTASQLFTPFFTTKPDGKGIGLTLARDILNRHNAEYSLSTGPDSITRFVIHFPSPGKTQSN